MNDNKKEIAETSDEEDIEGNSKSCFFVTQSKKVTNNSLLYTDIIDVVS